MEGHAVKHQQRAQAEPGPVLGVQAQVQRCIQVRQTHSLQYAHQLYAQLHFVPCRAHSSVCSSQPVSAESMSAPP